VKIRRNALLPQFITAATEKSIGKPLVKTYIRPGLALVTAFAVL